MLNQLKYWAGPALVTLTVLILYQLIVSPFINDMMLDWAFLHGARQQAIIQAQQAAQEKK
jgi:hypothetical protein